MKQKWMLLSLMTLLLTGCSETASPTTKPSSETKSTQKESQAPSSAESYQVTFKDEEGNLLETKTYKTGTTPSYDYQKEDTEEWHYTFLGWSKTKNGNVITLGAVTEDVTYYAIIKKEKVKYDIRFHDEEGKSLATVKTDYGTIPSYQYSKPSTPEWKYTFLGWSTTLGGDALPTLPAVTGEKDYYAVLSKTKQIYTIQFDSMGGSEVKDIQGEYGTTVEAPSNPTKEGYAFVSWCTDRNLTQPCSWPYTLTSNQTFYAKYNEAVNLKQYLNALAASLNQDPYSFIPKAMRPDYSKNHVTENQYSYDFTSFVNVSDIHYGGFGEQWEMVLDNIQQSERFFQVLTLADSAISSSVATFNNWFDKNPSSENKDISENGYYAKVSYQNNVLKYTIQIKTGWELPFFGQVTPQIDLEFDIQNNTKAIRINLTDTNALKYYITDTDYIFGIKYGVKAATRTAYCSLKKKEDEEVEGHIYEYIGVNGKETVKSCADFYLGKEYSSVIGNKASGILGMDGYINELYKTDEGN